MFSTAQCSLTVQNRSLKHQSFIIYTVERVSEWLRRWTRDRGSASIPAALVICNSLRHALNPHCLCPPSSNGHQVEWKLVLCEWLQLQKITLHYPQGDETMNEFQYLEAKSAEPTGISGLSTFTFYIICIARTYQQYVYVVSCEGNFLFNARMSLLFNTSTSRIHGNNMTIIFSECTYAFYDLYIPFQRIDVLASSFGE